ncbi:MerR family transcriptional regulator [Planococcus sp. S3-L1]|uniref:MerR family transcriptional regulator n=1 Tax=Planococcus sp. S3-L1 TaxID=3046200 RepID=UPI0024BA8A58|nr:MerR family transcriptional regulator [Planococcus sp. S3-L1]MDJ0333562.1 MerR family transcriptional regulator [Planococcus sp. S3-L1]
MTEEWFSVIELAEKTGIAEPSLRRYITKFHPYFISKGGNRAKKYDASAINLLLRIKTLYNAGYETIGVLEIIRQEFPMTINDPKHVDTTGNPTVSGLATTEDVAKLKNLLNDMNEKLVKQEEFNTLLIQKLENQNLFIKDTLKNKTPLLLEKVAIEEEVKKPAEKSKKGFWNRFFK